MMKILLLIVMIPILAHADAVIFSGSNVKALKQNLDLNGVAGLYSGSLNPTSSAVSANKGSLYLSTSTGLIYVKQDSGSTTNWTAQGAALSTPVSVANGGTGLTTLTANSVLLGNGTSNPTFVAPGTSGNVLTSNGTTWASSAPSLVNPINLPQIATPSPTPASGTNDLYFKSDGNLYTLNSNNTETLIGSGIQGTNTTLTSGFSFGGIGTPTSQSVYTRRVGDIWEVSLSMITGTASASTAFIQLPSGYLIDTTKMSSNTNGTQLGMCTGDIGSGSSASVMFDVLHFSEVNQILFYDGSTNNQVFFGYRTGSTADQINKDNGNTIFNSGQLVTCQFKIPIAGWSTQSPAGPNQAGTGMFVSNVIGGQQGISGASWQTFSNSPGFTFTPTITGNYKVYSNIVMYPANTGSYGSYRVYNTSGGATLLTESQSQVDGYPSSGMIQSVYALNAGTTYVFDIQGNATFGSIYLNIGGNFYMFAEIQAGVIGNGVTTIGSLDGGTANSTGAYLANNIFYQQSASSTNPGVVNNTTQTFSGSKTIGYNASDAIQIGGPFSTAIQSIIGGLSYNYRTATSSFTLDTGSADNLVYMNCSAACTMTLTTPSVNRVLRVKDISGTAGTNNITIAATIDGQTNFIINVNYGSVDLSWNSTGGWGVQ